MAKLTSKQRNSLPDSSFAIPSERKYPLNDASHRKNAKARASEMEDKGEISAKTEKMIDRKADSRMPHEKFHDAMAAKLTK